MKKCYLIYFFIFNILENHILASRLSNFIFIYTQNISHTAVYLFDQYRTYFKHPVIWDFRIHRLHLCIQLKLFTVGSIP